MSVLLNNEELWPRVVNSILPSHPDLFSRETEQYWFSFVMLLVSSGKQLETFALAEAGELCQSLWLIKGVSQLGYYTAKCSVLFWVCYAGHGTQTAEDHLFSPVASLCLI